MHLRSDVDRVRLRRLRHRRVLLAVHHVNSDHNLGAGRPAGAMGSLPPSPFSRSEGRTLVESGKTLDQGMDYGGVHAGRLRCPLVEGFLVERYWPGVTLNDVGLLNARLHEVSGSDASFVGSILVPEDEMVLFEFRARDVDAVLVVSGLAGLRCDRVVPATRLLDDDGPHAGPELGT